MLNSKPKPLTLGIDMAGSSLKYLRNRLIKTSMLLPEKKSSLPQISFRISSLFTSLFLLAYKNWIRCASFYVIRCVTFSCVNR